MPTKQSRIQGARHPTDVHHHHADIPCRTAIGLRVKDGVVLAVEKLVHSKLLVPGVNRRIQSIDKHICMVCTWVSDSLVKISDNVRRLLAY